MKHFLLICAFICALFLPFFVQAQTSIYVDSSVASSGSGSSWSTAFKTLNEALNVVNATSTGSYVVNVAKGTYFPPGTAAHRAKPLCHRHCYDTLPRSRNAREDCSHPDSGGCPRRSPPRTGRRDARTGPPPPRACGPTARRR